MKRMWSRNELKKIIKTLVESNEWSFEEDVTFNGLANFKDDVDIDGDLAIDGDFSVTGAINGEENPSVKPIYCHPITIDVEDEASKTHVAMLIFDNSNEEYNTYAKLVAKLNSIFALNANAVFPITGAIYYVAGSALHIAQKIGKSGDTINFYTCRPDGTQGNFNISNYIPNATIYDGVNKIN